MPGAIPLDDGGATGRAAGRAGVRFRGRRRAGLARLAAGRLRADVLVVFFLVAMCRGGRP